MLSIHASQNLTIDYDGDMRQLVVTVIFHEDQIIGHVPASCPRCEGEVKVRLWELEGPGSRSNTVWMTCGGESPCLLDDEVLRWSRQVVFEGDWEDV